MLDDSVECGIVVSSHMCISRLADWYTGSCPWINHYPIALGRIDGDYRYIDEHITQDTLKMVRLSNRIHVKLSDERFHR